MVRELVGHGLGRTMHEDPQVPNYGRKGSGKVIKDGLVVAIEPMVNLGNASGKIPQRWMDGNFIRQNTFCTF